MNDTIVLNGTPYRMSDIKSMEVFFDEDATPPEYMLLVAFKNKTWETFPLTFEILLKLGLWLQERHVRQTRIQLSERVNAVSPASSKAAPK